MTVQWFGSRIAGIVRDATVKGLVRATETVQAEATSLMNNSPHTGRVYRRNGVTHQASAPGEPPAPDTGALNNSIWTNIDEATVTGQVGVGAEYGAYLEFGTAKVAPRPFMRPALVNKCDAVRQDIAEEVTKALR